MDLWATLFPLGGFALALLIGALVLTLPGKTPTTDDVAPDAR